MKKTCLLLLLACISLGVQATPDLEEVAPATQGINGPVYLYTDSVTAVTDTSGMYNVVIVTDTDMTAPKERAITVNCADHTLRADWEQSSEKPLETRITFNEAFSNAQPGSAYDLLLQKICN